MIARIAGTMIVSVVVLVVVSLLASLGLLWLTGVASISAVIGGVCGLAVAVVVDAVSPALERAGGGVGRMALHQERATQWTGSPSEVGRKEPPRAIREDTQK
jgi:hypothetical protein